MFVVVALLLVVECCCRGNHDGVDGVLVPMDDHRRLVQRVLALLANPQLRDQLGTWVRQSALAWDQSVTLLALLD